VLSRLVAALASGRYDDDFLPAERSELSMAESAPRTITLAVHGPIARADLAGLCARICRLLEQGEPEIAFCDVLGIAPDAVTVEALARLQLAARRVGCRVLLRHASSELLELVAFMRLSEVLPA
jgi:hypothetical protein